MTLHRFSLIPKVAKNSRMTDFISFFFPHGHSLGITPKIYLYMYINGDTEVIKYCLEFNGQFSPLTITTNYSTR